MVAEKHLCVALAGEECRLSPLVTQCLDSVLLRELHLFGIKRWGGYSLRQQFQQGAQVFRQHGCGNGGIVSVGMSLQSGAQFLDSAGEPEALAFLGALREAVSGQRCQSGQVGRVVCATGAHHQA
jgi:hypothetical protein